ncbi:MAG: HAMP domain-containing histidine kinase [Clostridia bacterium]|nr:HAMP domain-containing histidine kinase [Clostridia bacterium]MBR0217505.1 HAMP domain-containing histidine kinase [Clostridia bacterium]
MKKNEHRLFLIWRYVTLFVLIAFVVTVSFRLFFHSMRLEESLIRQNAPLVFGNVLLLSLICCLIEWLLRRFTTDRVVRRIREATARMAAGDLTARIDTSDLLAASADYNEIARDFNKMAEELSGMQTLRTDFLASVSHELKTPLAVVRNYAVLLKNPSVTQEERLEYVEGICRAVDRTTSLMSNILKLNKLEHQTLISAATYDLGVQLAECMAAFVELCESHGIEMEADIAENLIVSADPELMEIVWNNLMSNAVKFTDTGGRITVTAWPDDDWIQTAVSDTGCGMDEKTGRHIFEKFYQGDTSHATEGNGLGLAMVRRIVDLSGGEIEVDSEPGRGSTFTVRIRRDSYAAE